MSVRAHPDSAFVRSWGVLPGLVTLFVGTTDPIAGAFLGAGPALWVVTSRPIDVIAVSTGATSAELGAIAVVIVAFLYFAVISVVLTLIDIDTHRLPNRIVLPSYLVAGILFTFAALLGGDAAALLRAGIGMAVLYAFYFVLRLLRPGGMGGGDLKLAGVIGMYLGWIGWGALAVGAFAAFLLGGLFGITLMLVRRAGRQTAIPFGPWMILGAWIGVFAGEAAAREYMSVFVGG